MEEFDVTIPFTITTADGDRDYTVRLRIPARDRAAALGVAEYVSWAILRGAAPERGPHWTAAGTITVTPVPATTIPEPPTDPDHPAVTGAGAHPLPALEDERAARYIVDRLSDDPYAIDLDVLEQLDHAGIHDPDRSIADRALYLIHAVRNPRPGEQ